jgi:hypothetical protein
VRHRRGAGGQPGGAGCDRHGYDGLSGCLYEVGRDFARAARQFWLAAQNAAGVFAHGEAVSLARRGLVENLTRYSLFFDPLGDRDRPTKLMNDLVDGTIDVAIPWGPMAGYYAKKLNAPIEIVALWGVESDFGRTMGSYFVPSALAEIVVLSDFWSPMPAIRNMLAGLSSSGAHGTLIQVVDPAEETFPYSGRVEFVEPEGGEMITAGRAESWMNDYVARVALHRDQIRAETNKLDWLFSTHTTSRSAAELLLFLHGGMMVSKGGLRSSVKAGRSA